jgi:hypothetical protein
MGPEKSRSLLASVCTVAALMAVLIGCGGGSSHISPVASHPEGTAPAAELVTKADAICKRINSVLVTSGSGSRDLHAISRSASRNAVLERVALNELDKLKPPPSLSRDWARIVEYRRTLAHELVELGRDAKADDRRAVQALAASKKRVHDKLFSLATRDGFKYCSEVRANAGQSGAAAPSGH